MNELYADRIQEVSITGTVVRIDFASLGEQKDAEGKAQLTLRQRIVIPVEGLVQSFGLLAQVMQELEKKGVIKRNPAPGGISDSGLPKSSNFS